MFKCLHANEQHFATQSGGMQLAMSICMLHVAQGARIEGEKHFRGQGPNL
jgi:hypothetical protein